MKDQTLFIDPPLEQINVSLIRSLNTCIEVVSQLGRIRVFQYEQKSSKPAIYGALINLIDFDLLMSCCKEIETMYKNSGTYIGGWLQYQALWDLEPAVVFQTIGKDLNSWQEILVQVKNARSLFDISKSRLRLPGVIVDFSEVQGKVSARYDQWQKDLLQRYGSLLGAEMLSFYGEVHAARCDLEALAGVGSTTQAVQFIDKISQAKVNNPHWQDNLVEFKSGHKILERNRFYFPASWLYLDQILGEWSAYQEIFDRKSKIIDEQADAIRLRVQTERIDIQKRNTEVLDEWASNKPIQGDILPAKALASLTAFSSKLYLAQQNHHLCAEAHLLLGLNFANKQLFDASIQELSDLVNVWTELQEIWDVLTGFNNMLWLSEGSSRIKYDLQALLTKMKGMPNHLRYYAAFEYMQDAVQNRIIIHDRVSMLNSEALRKRHWDRITALLGVESLSNLKVGDLWNSTKIGENKKHIDEIISNAQGELTLEKFLAEMHTFWTTFELTMVPYQNKCRLVKGWDEIFSRAEDNLASLTAMRNSPYFKYFKDQAEDLECKLTKLYALMDVWINVQRQWVYLEGIFTGNQDIKMTLPVESSKFVSIDTEFVSILRKAYKNPLVFEIVMLPNVQQSMNRLADMLSNIQKSLGDYLELERSIFPRFYFVGDEDLLEILGNSRNLALIQPHLKKMFHSIKSVILRDEKIVSILSNQGETLELKSPVKMGLKITEWLGNLEHESKETLHSLLTISLSNSSSQYLKSDVSIGDMKIWMISFPAQVILLSAQIHLTFSVEKAIAERNLPALVLKVESVISNLAELVYEDLDLLLRKKCEHMITELVYQRDMIRNFDKLKISSLNEFPWLSQMRFYFDNSSESFDKSLQVKMGHANFYYGYEYQGVADRLVQTPLTGLCYLTLCQALANNLGGSPFGPAGTGKTETVKSLASQLGKMCLVFCCDENFDFSAIGRILMGLSQVGAWGCFDEFNRLDENILSAVSQQIQSIQQGLMIKREVELAGRSITVHSDTSIFITMNPGYAGRSELPDNLRKLFRCVAMTVPDRLLIAQVMLFSQGFKNAEMLAAKAIPFFSISQEQLSHQKHYDFGLRALKSVLVSAGLFRRREGAFAESQTLNAEINIIVRSIKDTVFPKFMKADYLLAER